MSWSMDGVYLRWLIEWGRHFSSRTNLFVGVQLVQIVSDAGMPLTDR